MSQIYSSESKRAGKAQDSSEDKRDNIQYWIKWIKAARENKYAKEHRISARDAWDEYERRGAPVSGEGETRYKRSYPIWWSSSKTVEAAYFGRMPKSGAKRREGVDDAPALVAATLSKRLGEHALEISDFETAMSKSVQELIQADRCTMQLCYDAEKVKTRQNLTQDMQIPEGVEIQQDEAGYFYETEEVVEDTQEIYLKAVMYDEILHTPEAKSWLDIKELAYKFSISKDEALKRFPDLEGKEVNWKQGKYSSEDEDSSDSDTETTEKYIEGWEIYCKETKHIYWVAPACYPHDVLDKKPDEWELRGFFPSPKFVIGSCPAKHLYPTPPFVQLSSTIKQLHVLYARIFDLIDGIKRRALVDGSCPELLRAFDELDNQEFITVENLGGLVEKAGGVSNLVWYLPVQELVQAIAELKELDVFFNEKFDLHFGIPDILRGVTDPLATASAEQIASGAAHDRFKWVKAQVTKLGSDALEMMVDLMLKVYSPEKIARICRVQYMSPQDQALFPQALAILQNDQERLIRVEIQTDSMSFQNEQIENSNRNAVVQTVVGGLKEISGMLANGQPQFAAVAMHGTLHALDGLSGGGEFIEEIKSYSSQLIDQAMNPPEQEPPPDYEAMKIQQKSEEIQIKAQTDQAQLAQGGQKHADDVQLKLKEIELRTYELQIKERELLLKERELEVVAQKDAVDAHIDGRMQSLTEGIETSRLDLERMKIALGEREKLLEEKRLAFEAAIEHQKLRQPAARHVSIERDPETREMTNLTIENG